MLIDMDPDRVRLAELEHAARQLETALTGLLADARAEQARRRDHGDEQGARALAPVILNLLPAHGLVADLATANAVLQLLLQPDCRPQSLAELTAMTGRDPGSVRRAVADMVAAGLIDNPRHWR